MQDWEIVERAADIMEEKGHCTGALLNTEGRVCIDGALALAIGHSESALYGPLDGVDRIYNDEELNRIASRILNVVDSSWCAGYVGAADNLYTWNDRMRWDVEGNNVTYWSEERVSQFIIDETRRAAKEIRIEDENAGRKDR